MLAVEVSELRVRYGKLEAVKGITLEIPPGEVFGLDAASGLNSFAVQKGIQRVSMWSLNRDRECAAAAADGQASHVCSGVQQEPGQFAKALAAGFEGKLR